TPAAAPSPSPPRCSQSRRSSSRRPERGPEQASSTWVTWIVTERRGTCPAAPTPCRRGMPAHAGLAVPSPRNDGHTYTYLRVARSWAEDRAAACPPRRAPAPDRARSAAVDDLAAGHDRFHVGRVLERVAVEEHRIGDFTRFERAIVLRDA